MSAPTHCPTCGKWLSTRYSEGLLYLIVYCAWSAGQHYSERLEIPA